MRVHAARLFLLLVLIVAVATALSVPAVSVGAAELTYPQRLTVAKRLARQYSGDATPGSPLARYGLWAATIVQTDWEQHSGRDEIPLWNLVNFGLSVEPSAYATERSHAKGTKDPTVLCASSAFVRENPTPPTAVGPAVDRETVCRDWMEVFDTEERGAANAELQRALWRADADSIVHSLRVYGGAFERPDVSTEQERNFWASWIQLRFVLGAMNYPTDGAGVQAVLKTVMPPCAPIGGAGCALTPDDLGSSFAFVSALSSRPASLAQTFAMYEASRTNPAALAPEVLAFSDPALAAGLSAFLAA
jgi:hypothetical protein